MAERDSLPKLSEANGDLDKLLAYLKHNRGFDFSAYKKSTLGRRILKRMQTCEVNTFEGYQDYLEVHPDEFQELFNTILINVTSFFRDDDAWQYMSQEVIPRIIEGASRNHHIRAWVAGCASGEEAYTLAMVLAEALGLHDFKQRVKIYATDLDEDALNHSRGATYLEREVENVPETLRQKYFEKSQDKYVFDRELRRCVIFGRHDLLQDAPISRVDLLVCRNTLMYFNAEAQDRILSRFHFALKDGGFLFLGKAETMLAHNGAFAPVDLKNRVFAKLKGRLRDRSYFVAPVNGNGDGNDNGNSKIREFAFETGPVAQIAIDLGAHVVAANERARAMFGISPRDFGKLIQDLEISYKPLELRSGLEQAHESRRPVVYKEIRWTTGNENLVLDIRILPIVGNAGEVLGTTVTFEDITQFKRLQEDLLNFNQELETAYEEVQSTNEELQTTNEELQSTIEELETTNEELQSTNEELETMNEELQSTNEELETINEELRSRSDELNQANAFLESILSSLSEGVIVIDHELRVVGWNSRSEDLWGLRKDEVKSKHLLNLDIGLPVQELRIPIKNCLNGSSREEVVINCMNRRGKSLRCRALMTPLHGVSVEARGVIILVEELPEAR